MSSQPISQADLKQLLEYDAGTGLFRWRISSNNRIKAGSVAGSFTPEGYARISITIDGNRRRLMAHSLAWLYMTGAWPAALIDHRDGNPSNNVFTNLRPATRSQNKMNEKLRKDNAQGFKGVRYRKAYTNRPFIAVIRDGVKGQRTIGYFRTPEEASAAYVDAAREAFGEFARAK